MGKEGERKGRGGGRGKAEPGILQVPELRDLRAGAVALCCPPAGVALSRCPRQPWA